MNTQCTPRQLEFHAFDRREVVGRFDAGRLTSDGGAILLREVDRRLGLTQRIADCFADYRDPRKVEHSVLEMVTQRVGGIALGYEDLNDHDALRGDSLLALWAGKADLTGAQRPRQRDRGYALVVPYRKSNKNDVNDADAIVEASSRPSMRFVGLKSVAQQHVQQVHRARRMAVGNRTAQANEIHGFLLEYRIESSRRGALLSRLAEVLEDAENELPHEGRALLREMGDESRG